MAGKCGICGVLDAEVSFDSCIVMVSGRVGWTRSRVYRVRVFFGGDWTDVGELGGEWAGESEGGED